MATATDKIPGISIVVDDLVRVRGLLSGISGSRIRRLSSLHSGAREVRLRGRGMEYEESRAYVYGDDFRTMDWRVMARTGDAHTKVFAEEKERRCLLAVDLSASMYFGTRYGFKSWAAAQVAAHAGWLASFAGERIGGLIVTPAQHNEIRPDKTRSGLLGVPLCQPAQFSAERAQSRRQTRNQHRPDFGFSEYRRADLADPVGHYPPQPGLLLLDSR
jgi:hypothetical protein